MRNRHRIRAFVDIEVMRLDPVAVFIGPTGKRVNSKFTASLGGAPSSREAV
ncbi:MAG: hypothetical protein LBJ46_05045 [Planctomycetota bacterium]|nr:hypothetical protein [Planctomycetota bacterium]